VIAVYASPKYVIVPVMFLWLGNGLMTKAYFVMLAVLPVVAIYTLTGIRTVDPDARQMMQLLGATRGQIGRKLLLPHALGYLLTAVAYTIPLTISMALGAEILMGATDGLGGMLNTASFNFNIPQVYAALALASVLSVLLIASAQLLSVRLYGVRGMSGRR
jgi:NitT/TauT family transport system permease protein